MSSETVQKAVTPWELTRDLPNNFDAVRLLLSVCVIYVHSITSLRGTDLAPEESDPLCYVTRGSIHLGEIAVGGFFMLSGLLISHSWTSSRGVWDFIVKRVLRIYPAFLGVVLFCTFIVGPISSQSFVGFLRKLDIDMWLACAMRLSLSLPALFVGNPQPYNANVSLWTIPYEFDCYLCILALGSTQLLTRRRFITAIWMAVFVFHLADTDVHWPRFLTCFFSGTVFYLYRDSIPKTMRMLSTCLAVLLLFGFVAPTKLPFLIPVCGTYVLFFIAFSNSVLHNIREKMGDVSYGMYLFAFPVQQLLVQFWRESFNPTTLFITATAITFPLALLSWFLVEQPFLNILRRSESSVLKGLLKATSSFCVFTISVFGICVFAHVLGGAKVGKFWQLVYHTDAPLVLVAIADVVLAAWAIWGFIVLTGDKKAVNSWQKRLAQAPFGIWFAFIALQSLTSFVRTLPAWLPNN